MKGVRSPYPVSRDNPANPPAAPPFVKVGAHDYDKVKYIKLIGMQSSLGPA